ncbi:NHL repeat-containing protein [Paenibacillus mendelii]|uniref:NHL repeat-containing protein n=1 Tax=Paenibacillus mendelii TaxID=206163 RepID=A0ABV6JAQ7_9BACL|nr:NHL repeat-containing protein [Paenibacillus mendelii]MCQ6563115.1 hypothetical protein [Paenibacillus mendelii]
MRTKGRLGVVLAVTAALLLTLPMTAFAEIPYAGYTYNNKQNSVPSINGYVYADSIDGFESTAGAFQDIQDIFIAKDDTLYIVDSANNRIIHYDKNKQLLGIIGDTEGKGQLNMPKGVFVTDDDKVYVADTKNNRIAVFDKDGEFVREFLDPKSKLLGSNFMYLPSKVIVDKNGNMFIVCDGLYRGLLQLNANGEFAGLFGANHVEFSLTKLISNLISTEEQKKQIAGEKPPEFSNLFLNEEGFIYTTTLGIRQEQIKRLSSVGKDTLNEQSSLKDKHYGDFNMRGGRMIYEAFVDLSVDRQGFITTVDQTTGKLFQYDSLGNPLFIFGGLGTQNGLFITPSSVAQTSDGVIYVADKSRNRIDRFRITPFGELVHKASVLYVDGLYEEAQEPWQEVLELNGNFDMAYFAIGKSLYKQERYKEAMTYFKTARASDEYSKAFLEYRKGYIQDHFAVLFAGVIGLYILFQLTKMLYRRRKRARRNGRFVSKAEGGEA